MAEKRYRAYSSLALASAAAAKLGLDGEAEKDLYGNLSQLGNGPVKEAFDLLTKAVPNAVTKKRVVFDVDDVLWPLNEHVAWKAGIDFHQIATFFARENYMLSDEEKERLYEAYQVPGIHRHMDFYPGAGLIACIARDPAFDAWLCSNSINTESRDQKLGNLERLLGADLGLFQLLMPVVDMADSHSKKLPEDIWCMVDDSPKNAVDSKAEHILMPRKPWNQSAWGQRVLKPVMPRVRFFDTVPECVGMILKLARKEG